MWRCGVNLGRRISMSAHLVPMIFAPLVDGPAVKRLGLTNRTTTPAICFVRAPHARAGVVDKVGLIDHANTSQMTVTGRENRSRALTSSTNPRRRRRRLLSQQTAQRQLRETACAPQNQLFALSWSHLAQEDCHGKGKPSHETSAAVACRRGGFRRQCVTVWG